MKLAIATSTPSCAASANRVSTSLQLAGPTKDPHLLFARQIMVPSKNAQQPKQLTSCLVLQSTSLCHTKRLRPKTMCLAHTQKQQERPSLNGCLHLCPMHAHAWNGCLQIQHQFARWICWQHHTTNTTVMQHQNQLIMVSYACIYGCSAGIAQAHICKEKPNLGT